MRVKLFTYFEKLRASYWFIPAIMVIISILLSFVTIALDEAYPFRLEDILGWIDVAEAEGAYVFLSIVSGAMIGITGVTFSITIVALVQASSQFGPRLLNNFLRDRGNQVVLGSFISTYTYCLLIIRSIKSTPDQVFVPNLSMFVALVLAVNSVAILVYFFHHVSVLLQAEHIVASVGRELNQAIERLFPEATDYSLYAQKLRSESDIPAGFHERSTGKIESELSGYLQAIDIGVLVKICEQHNIILNIGHKPGDFVTKDGELLEIMPAEAKDEELAQQIRGAFVLGNQRLRINDVEFIVNQLVEIAVRALSTGINDPFTAIACVDQLASGLSELVQRGIPSGYHYDSQGKLRLLTNALTFSSILEAAFNQIRQNAYSNIAVTIRLLDAIIAIAHHAVTKDQRTTLSRQAQMLYHTSEQVVIEKLDLEDIKKRFDSAMKILQES